jgi:hypothetical protein
VNTFYLASASLIERELSISFDLQRIDTCNARKQTVIRCSFFSNYFEFIWLVYVRPDELIPPHKQKKLPQKLLR